MPAREGWLVADAAGDADLGPLDALSNRREVSASVRALAAYAGWLFSDMRTPRQLDHTKREERAFQLLRNLGPPLRECIPSGVVMDGLCPCPKLGWL
jgi:hypothetical protein